MVLSSMSKFSADETFYKHTVMMGENMEKMFHCEVESHPVRTHEIIENQFMFNQRKLAAHTFTNNLTGLPTFLPGNGCSGPGY